MKKSLFVFLPILLLGSCKPNVSKDLLSLDKTEFSSVEAFPEYESSYPFSASFKKTEKDGSFLYAFTAGNVSHTMEETRRLISPDEGTTFFYIGYDHSYTLIKDGNSDKDKRIVKGFSIYFSSSSSLSKCQARLKNKEKTYCFSCQRENK